MIPTLKDMHERQMKQRLQELKESPEMLQEVLDQRQLNDMERALKKLTELFKAPEFKGLTSFHLGLQKAYSSLTDLLTSSKLTRALKLRKELKDIATFTAGITRLLKQLPQVANIIRHSASGTEDMDPDEPIAHSLDRDQMDKLQTVVKKAMKPGFFGISDLPYINSDEAAFELLSLSLNQMAKLQELSGRGQILRQTISDPGFIDHMKDVISSITEPKKAAEEAPPPEQTKLDIPQPQPSQANASAAAPKLPTVNTTLQDFRAMFDQQYLRIYGTGRKLSAPEKERVDELKHQLALAVARWLDEKQLLTRKKNPG